MTANDHPTSKNETVQRFSAEGFVTKEAIGHFVLCADYDEVREWATKWHGLVESIATVLGVNSALGLDEISIAIADALHKLQGSVRETGSDAHAERLEEVLRGLYWDNVDYLVRNKLGGMNNHWMRAAREALHMDPDDLRPSPEETPVTLSSDGMQVGRWVPLNIHAADAEKTEPRCAVCDHVETLHEQAASTHKFVPKAGADALTSTVAAGNAALICDGACRYDNYGRLDRDPNCSTHGSSPNGTAKP